MRTSQRNVLRTVFDTNIYVAAALRPGQYADRWLDIAALPGSGLQLFVSPYILAEIRQKLVDRFEIPDNLVREFIGRVEVSATVVSPPDFSLAVVPDDPDDDAIVACAVEAHAQLIVTADNHLLKLDPYQGIGITHPKELKNIFATEYKNR